MLLAVQILRVDYNVNKKDYCKQVGKSLGYICRKCSRYYRTNGSLRLKNNFYKQMCLFLHSADSSVMDTTDFSSVSVLPRLVATPAVLTIQSNKTNNLQYVFYVINPFYV